MDYSMINEDEILKIDCLMINEEEILKGNELEIIYILRRIMHSNNINDINVLRNKISVLCENNFDNINCKFILLYLYTYDNDITYRNITKAEKILSNIDVNHKYVQYYLAILLHYDYGIKRDLKEKLFFGETFESLLKKSADQKCLMAINILINISPSNDEMFFFASTYSDSGYVLIETTFAFLLSKRKNIKESFYWIDKAYKNIYDCDNKNHCDKALSKVIHNISERKIMYHCMKQYEEIEEKDKYITHLETMPNSIEYIEAEKRFYNAKY